MTVTVSAGTEATLLGRKVRLHDLSQEVSQRSQMHPLHPRVEVYPFESHANSLALLGTGFSYRANLMILSDHASTHVDALTHFDPDPDAPTIDQMPLELFCGEAICLDLSELPPRAGITVADLEAALAKDGLDLREGDIVLLYTGHYERTTGTPEYLTEFPVHQVCRELHVTHMENIGPLAAVAGKRFTLFGFPLKIVPGTGSPIRLVAAVPED